MFTNAAFVKMLDAGPPANPPRGSYLEGWRLGAWTLSYSYSGGSSGGYSHHHPWCQRCTFLLALPGTVYGRMDLSNPQSWWNFPPINGPTEGV